MWWQIAEGWQFPICCNQETMLISRGMDWTFYVFSEIGNFYSPKLLISENLAHCFSKSRCFASASKYSVCKAFFQGLQLPQMIPSSAVTGKKMHPNDFTLIECLSESFDGWTLGAHGNSPPYHTVILCLHGLALYIINDFAHYDRTDVSLSNNQ